MMSEILKLMLFRAINTKLSKGETLDNIIDSYPGLSKEDIEEINKAFSKTIPMEFTSPSG